MREDHQATNITSSSLDHSYLLVTSYKLQGLHVYEMSICILLCFIESNTGITEKVIQSIDLYPHRLSFRTHNLPTAYKPGQSLHLPVSVTNINCDMLQNIW